MKFGDGLVASMRAGGVPSSWEDLICGLWRSE